MEKEELKNLKDWCIGMETLINLISTHKKRVPESVELITEQPADKSGTRNAAYRKNKIQDGAVWL